MGRVKATKLPQIALLCLSVVRFGILCPSRNGIIRLTKYILLKVSNSRVAACVSPLIAWIEDSSILTPLCWNTLVGG